MNRLPPQSAARRRLAAAACCAALFAVAPVTAQEPSLDPLPEDRRTGAAEITEPNLKTWLSQLASEEFAGRGTGQPGFAKAAAYVRDHFRELGLEPGNGDSYLQRVPWQMDRAKADATFLRVVSDAGATAAIESGDLHGELGAGLSIEGPLTFVCIDRAAANAFEGQELDGAAVLLHVRDGLLAGQDERAVQRFGPLLAQRVIAELRQAVEGAGGKLAAIVDDSGAEMAGGLEPRSYPAPTEGQRSSRGRRMRPAFLVITTEQANRLAAVADVKDGWAASIASDADGPAMVKTNATLVATIEIESTTDRDAVPAENVLGWLPGSDPELRDEYVAIGCHLDHLGVRGGTIHPGADDDGSGSAGLMAIAQAFAKNPVRPRRSVLFLAFCGEENGLVGSGYYARNPTRPLDKMIAELQIDMIGRNEEGRGETAADNLDCLHLIGSQKLSNDLHEICLKLNESRAGFALEWDEEDVFYRSDHWNFARVGVPIAFFFTGFHPQYHQPSDTVDKIDFTKLRRVATYVYDLGWELANADGRPMVDAERWEALERKGAQEPVAPVRGR